LFYITKVAQNGGRRLHCMFCTAWICYAELFEQFPAFPGWFQLLLQFLPQDHVVSPLESRTPDARHFPGGFSCYCNSCHKIMLCLHWSLVHRLCMYPRERNQMESSQGERGGQVIGPPRPIHLFAKVPSKYSRTSLVQCAGAPSCWNQISRRTSDYWASTSNPSVAKGFIQILRDDISAVCQGAIMLEPLFTTDFRLLGLHVQSICCQRFHPNTHGRV
jgi:hypothetical protein